MARIAHHRAFDCDCDFPKNIFGEYFWSVAEFIAAPSSASDPD